MAWYEDFYYMFFLKLMRHFLHWVLLRYITQNKVSALFKYKMNNSVYEMCKEFKVKLPCYTMQVPRWRGAIAITRS